jgi:hypothetical protein
MIHREPISHVELSGSDVAVADVTVVDVTDAILQCGLLRGNGVHAESSSRPANGSIAEGWPCSRRRMSDGRDRTSGPIRLVDQYRPFETRRLTMW